MEIKILGTGCSNCKTLFANVQQAAAELKLNATITKEENMVKIMAYNVMQLPALVIDEIVVAKGKLSFDEVKKLLQNYSI
ncbi:MAG: thioredoxin family protein [Bacteroidales bacterium]|nr:thioredoxin family protein [Bacteroidales bacterium]